MALGKEAIAALQTDISTAKKRDMNFAFCKGKTPETGVLLCHKTKQGNALHKIAKKEGETNKIASGIMNVQGKIVMLTCPNDPPPAIARSIKMFLKLAGLSMKVVILDADGQELESDGDEDEADENAQNENTQSAESTGNDNKADLAALKGAVAALAGDIKNIPDADAQAKLGAALKKVAAGMSAGDLKKSATDLKHVQAVVERTLAAGSAAKVEPDAAQNTDDGGWRSTADALEPQVLAALKANHPEATKLRAVWGFAQEKAQAGEFAAALKAAERLDAMLQAAPAAPSDTPPQNVVAFQRSRILWIDAKQSMRDGLEKFRSAVAQQSSDDEDKGEIAGAVDGLVAQFDAFDTRLEDILDAITQSPEGPERGKLKSQAARAITNYLAVLDNPFFQIVDNNPFVAVNVAARGKSSLALVQSTLA